MDKITYKNKIYNVHGGGNGYLIIREAVVPSMQPEIEVGDFVSNSFSGSTVVGVDDRCVYYKDGYDYKAHIIKVDRPTIIERTTPTYETIWDKENNNGRN